MSESAYEGGSMSGDGDEEIEMEDGMEMSDMEQQDSENMSGKQSDGDNEQRNGADSDK